MLVYAALHLLGYEAMTIEQIRRFRQLGSITAGHPEHGHTPGVETTTGPLGQGLGNAVGMAIAERHLAAVFGKEIVDHYTYVLCSDGDLMEGISQESIALAGHLRLHKLIVLFDDNGISIDGPLSLSDSVDQVKRFEAAGWIATRIDGHDPTAIAAAIETAKTFDRPTLIACRTTIGYGAPNKAGSANAHGSPLGAEEIAGARAALGWNEPPFHSRRCIGNGVRPDNDRSRRAGLGRQARCTPGRTARRILTAHSRRSAAEKLTGAIRAAGKLAAAPKMSPPRGLGSSA
jgi:transketolase